MNIEIKRICAIMLSLIFMKCIMAQNYVCNDDSDFVKASIIITSVGEWPQQITGHAALRMQCDSLGLDRVFTFDNNVGNDLKKFYLEGGKGRIFENEYVDYIQYVVEEGRQLSSYQLNFTLDEEIRLWEVLDSLKLLPERGFDIRENHCFSVIAATLNESISPSKINWDGAALRWGSYSEIAKTSGGATNPWNYILMMLALGNMADKAGQGKEFIYPTTFEIGSGDFKIMSNDGHYRPLTKQPEILIKATKENIPKRPTPTDVAFIFLILVIAITIYQIVTKRELIGQMTDIVIWVIVIFGGVMIMFVTYLPNHYGGNWNWPLLVFNPFAFMPLIIFRKKIIFLKVIWAIYAGVLICFAIFIGYVAPSIELFWRLLALGIAIRCLWHVKHLYDLTFHRRPKG